MKSLSEFLDFHAQHSFEEFQQELSTDENKDYRRGFRAGVLFSYLHIKSNIRNMDAASTEQPVR
jgi:hypothetical protein